MVHDEFYMDANTSVGRLLTPDKWEITDMRSEFDDAIGDHSRPRTVYNISDQQGEYCWVGNPHSLLRRGLELDI